MEIKVNHLTDKSKPWGYIRFIHIDGSENIFWSCVNSMGGSRLSSFNDKAPSINDDMSWVKGVFKKIRTTPNIKVLEEVGTL